MRARLALAAVAALAYLNALGHPLVYDDAHALAWHPTFADPHSFVAPRLVTGLSYSLDALLWPGSSFGPHAINVLLHVAVVLLLFALGRRQFADTAAAFVAAVLFAVHPLGSEAVGYVAARADLLCAAFSLAALISWADGRTRLAIALFIVALLCKEIAAVLPLVFAAWDRWIEPRPRFWRVVLPMLLVTLVAGVARLALHHAREGGRLLEPVQLATQCSALCQTLALALAPVGQTIYHVIRPLRPNEWRGLLALAGALALCLSPLLLARSQPRVAIGLLIAVTFLLPPTLVPLGEPMAEHRAYVSLAGVCLAAAPLLIALPRPRLIVALLAGVLAATTIARNRVWSSPVALWSEASAKAPRAWGPHYALGDALRIAGDCTAAVGQYRAATALRPLEPRPYINLALCLDQLGRGAEAEAALSDAIAHQPRDWVLHDDLGQLLLRHGDRERARAEFQRALELNPDYAPARANLMR